MNFKTVVTAGLAALFIGAAGAGIAYEGVPAWKHHQAVLLEQQNQYQSQRAEVLAAGTALSDASKHEDVVAAHAKLNDISDQLTALTEAYTKVKAAGLPQQFLDEIASRYSAAVSEGYQQVQVVDRHTKEHWTAYTEKWTALDNAFSKKLEDDTELQAQLKPLNDEDEVTDTVRDIVEPLVEDATTTAKGANTEGQQVSSEQVAAEQLKLVTKKLDDECTCADDKETTDSDD